MSKEGIVVLTHGVGCYNYICSLGFLRTFIYDVALQSTLLCIHIVLKSLKRTVKA